MAETNSIADRLGMDFDDLDLGYDFGDEGEEYDNTEHYDRSVGFDILWDELGEHPESVEDPVVEAIIDDTDHRYRITYNDQERETAVTGIALFAYLDDDASVEVDPDG